MEQYYKLDKIRELADNDVEFIETLAMTFVEEVAEDAGLLETAAISKDHLATYKTAHKMKPTIDMFEVGVLDDLVEIQDWGKLEQRDKDITEKLNVFLTAVRNAVEEIKTDFNL